MVSWILYPVKAQICVSFVDKMYIKIIDKLFMSIIVYNDVYTVNYCSVSWTVV